MSSQQALQTLKPVTLITGASSGIGAALARVFAAHGHELAVTARRREPLDALAADLVKAGHKAPHVVTADLADRDGPVALAEALAAQGLEPAVVVNNAGFGLYGAAASLDIGEQLAVIDLDARAVTELSLRFADSVKRHRGGILNVASIAGFLTGENMAVYFASKAYVVSLSQALHRELAPHGVKVSALCPGPVRTAFFGRAGMGPKIFPSFLYMPADAVARAGYDGFMRGKRIIIPGFMPKLVVTLERFFPGLMQARHGTQTARARR
ncbi:MAG: Short-chain dehydrogenase [Pseudolabrys sp.]|nr:Short-chain dehydrogenase [Pseudolabrys sp.]